MLLTKLVQKPVFKSNMPQHFKQFILFCIFSLGVVSSIHSQTFVLKGKVTDATTGEDLIGASVISQTGKGIATNALGEYKLTLSTNKIDTITYKSVGFVTKTFVFDPSNYSFSLDYKVLIINIELEEEAILTEELVITAGRNKQKLKNVTVSMELIKPYLFQERNNVNLDDGVNQIPGVSFVDGQASIRGGSGWSYGAGTRVLVLLDDMPMVSGDANQVQWSYIPMESIEQVEVLKGASSVLYGSSALNGVINIRTIRPKDKPYTAVNLFSGFYDNNLREGLKWQGNRLLSNSGASIVHAQRWNNFEGTFSINHLNDEGFRMGEPERRTRFSFNTRYTPKKAKNLIYGINGNVMASRVGSFFLWESYELGYTQLDSGFNYTNTTRYNIDPYVIFYTGETRHTIRGRYFYLDNNVDNGDPDNDQSNTSNYYYAEYQFQHDIKKWKLSLVGGVAGNYTLTNSPIFEGVHVSANIAPFLQLERKWKKLTINAGARYESFRLDDYTESKPVFRAGANYELGKATFLRASYGQGYRFPSIVESFVRTSSGPLQVYPNPDLRSETGWNAEVAVKQGFKLGKWQGFADVAGFWSECDRMIEFNFGRWGPNLGFDNLLGLGFSSVNVGETRITGIDISIGGEGKIGNTTLNIIGGYTYINPISLNPDAVYDFDIDGNPLTYKRSSSDSTSNILKYRFRHLAKLDVQAKYKSFSIGLSGRYNSYMQTVDAFFVDPLFELFVGGIEQGREENKNGNLVIDFRTAYEVNEKLKAAIIITNLTNNIFMVRPADMSPPRLFTLQLSYKVK